MEDPGGMFADGGEGEPDGSGLVDAAAVDAGPDGAGWGLVAVGPGVVGGFESLGVLLGGAGDDAGAVFDEDFRDGAAVADAVTGDVGTEEFFEFGPEGFGDAFLGGEAGYDEAFVGDLDADAGGVEAEGGFGEVIGAIPGLLGKGKTEFAEDPGAVAESVGAILGDAGVGFAGTVAACHETAGCGGSVEASGLGVGFVMIEGVSPLPVDEFLEDDGFAL